MSTENDLSIHVKELLNKTKSKTKKLVSYFLGFIINRLPNARYKMKY